MSKINLLAPTTIGVPDDRQPDPATVAALKASMAEIGLLNPILVQRYAGCGAPIVAGRNRLQAAIELGWDAINAIELPELNGGADAVAVGKLAEIAENLHRREISALERDELVVRWVALVAERKKGQTAQDAQAVLSDGRKAGPQHRSRGISQTARELNMPRDEVRRAMKVGNLSPEAKEAAHKHGLADNRDALLEAAKAKTPEAQAEVIRQRAAQAKPRTPSAPPRDKPVSAKRMSSKRKCSENNCVAGLAQEPVLHLFEGDRLAARIISARNGVQLFVARPEGLRMVGRYPNRRRAIAALAGVLP